MEIRFEAGLKRPRDATKSAKLVSEAPVVVRCLIRLQRIYNFDYSMLLYYLFWMFNGL